MVHITSIDHTSNKLILIVIVLYGFLLNSCFSATTPTILCKSEEKSALLEFKNLFTLDGIPNDYCDDSNIFQWHEEDQECCEWSGVVCNDDTGYVNTLILDSSCLYGTIPTNSSLYKLEHLEVIFLEYNYLNNTQVSPLFGKLKNLAVLDLKESELSGVVPNEIFQLPKLETLDLSGNSALTGSIASINTTELISLDLSGTGFSGEIPNSIGNFKNLTTLSLRGCNFSGPIPESLGYLTKLNILDLGNNSFSGKVPLSLSKLVNLTQLDFSYNNLEGPILGSVLKLRKFTQLFLTRNRFTDSVDLILFMNLLDLEYLDLSYSGLSLTTTSPNFLSAFRTIRRLSLSSCNLKFEDRTMNIVNHLEVEAGPVANGSIYVDLSNNKINEEILPSICKLNFLYLDLSNNQLSGPIPDCLFKNIRSLAMLKLSDNKFQGTIPRSVGLSANLKLIDISNNELHGDLPRSLGNCSQLEVINLGNNQLADKFPFWLGSLPLLKVFILRENKFNGTMTTTSKEKRGNFDNLRIIDMSQNDLTGTLPSEYFEIWDAMTVVDTYDSQYAYVKTSQSLCDGDQCGRFQEYSYYYSLNISNKGSILEYHKVFATMKVVDFSGNKFTGIIPQSIGRLKGIQVLNISTNNLTGQIPNSIGNLTYLESLDLSGNMLSGEIPPEMSNLKFLGFFNISENNITGVIPQSGQLATFSNASYDGNPGLCGSPLSRSCTKTDTTNLTPPELASQNSHGFFKLEEFGWEIVLSGYVLGVVIGLVGGYFCISVTDKTWFVRIFYSKSHRTNRYK